MLSTLTTQLSSFFSRYFILGSFCPLLASVFLNGLNAYFVFDAWHDLVDRTIDDPNQSVGRSAFLMASALIGVALGAYVLSSLSTFLRQVLEGRSWGPMRWLFIPMQNRRRARLIARLEDLGKEITELRDAPTWRQDLQTARAKGAHDYPERKTGLETKADLSPLDPITAALAKLARRRFRIVSTTELEPIVGMLCLVLPGYDATASFYLNQRYLAVRRLLKRAREDAAHPRADARKRLRDAFDAGKAGNPGKRLLSPRDAAAHVRLLDRRRADFQSIGIDDLQALIEQLSGLLETYDAEADRRLNTLHEKLVRLIDYAHDRTGQIQVRLQNELITNFGMQDVAPTRMGNIANSIQSYALRRYHCNLEALWSNLQYVAAQSDKDKDDSPKADRSGAGPMQAAKAQLDFLVAAFWLTLVTAVAWSAVFLFVAPSRYGFPIAAVLGPLIAYMWYAAAAEQYRAFADLMMTTFDTFRFELLKQMRLGLPADVEDEQEIWRNIDLLTTFGEARNFHYQHPDK